MNLQKLASYVTKGRLIGLAIFVAALVVLYVAASFYIVGRIRAGNLTSISTDPSSLGLAYQDVSFHPRGDSSLTLRGWWIPAANPVGTVIRAHPFDGNRSDQMDMLKVLADAHLNVLAFDFRGDGESDKATGGAGSLEISDLQGAIDYVLHEQSVAPGSIVLMGRGLGAAVALMTGFNEPSVAGVFADSSFDTLWHAIDSEIQAHSPFPSWVASLLHPGISLAAGMGGLDISAVRPVDDIAKYTYPLGLTHCLDDTDIPIDQSHHLRQQVNGPVYYTLFPDCGHGGAFEKLPRQYADLVLSYVGYALNLPEPIASAP